MYHIPYTNKTPRDFILLIFTKLCPISMHCSAKFQTLPNAVDLLSSCEGVFLLCFLGHISPDNIILIYWIKIPHLLLLMIMIDSCSPLRKHLPKKFIKYDNLINRVPVYYCITTTAWTGGRGLTFDCLIAFYCKFF